VQCEGLIGSSLQVANAPQKTRQPRQKTLLKWFCSLHPGFQCREFDTHNCRCPPVTLIGLFRVPAKRLQNLFCAHNERQTSQEKFSCRDRSSGKAHYSALNACPSSFFYCYWITQRSICAAAAHPARSRRSAKMRIVQLSRLSFRRDDGYKNSLERICAPRIFSPSLFLIWRQPASRTQTNYLQMFNRLRR